MSAMWFRDPKAFERAVNASDTPRRRRPSRPASTGRPAGAGRCLKRAALGASLNLPSTAPESPMSVRLCGSTTSRGLLAPGRVDARTGYRY
jgi:hypothetical protein